MSHTSAPADAASAAVASVDPSTTTMISVASPPSSAGISAITDATVGSSLYAGITTATGAPAPAGCADRNAAAGPRSSGGRLATSFSIANVSMRVLYLIQRGNPDLRRRDPTIGQGPSDRGPRAPENSRFDVDLVEQGSCARCAFNRPET